MSTSEHSTSTLSRQAQIIRFSRENMLVLTAQVIAWAGLITLCHQDIQWWWKIPIIFFFCMMMQGVFSFMHECYHGHGHHNKRINWAVGWLSSCIFGTSYTLTHINHEGHHTRNRTPPELVDYILPGESATKKIVSYYIAIFGGIWLLALIGTIVIPFLPFKIAGKLAIDRDNNTYSQAFEDFKPQHWWLMRLELLLCILFWAGAIYLFQWQWQTLLLIYACFAFSWSSLQWVYHVRTPIHVIEGAYNLRAPKIIRLLFLNFNYNLTHHRNATFFWQELYQVSNQKETQPLWYRYFNIFLPPKPLPEDVNTIKKKYF